MARPPVSSAGRARPRGEADGPADHGFMYTAASSTSTATWQVMWAHPEARQGTEEPTA